MWMNGIKVEFNPMTDPDFDNPDSFIYLGGYKNGPSNHAAHGVTVNTFRCYARDSSLDDMSDTEAQTLHNLGINTKIY